MLRLRLLRGWGGVGGAQYPLGQFSPYGDEMFPLLQSVVERGGVDPAALTQDLYAAFKAYPGRLNQASKDLVANVDAGKTYPHAGASNDQAHCLVKVRAGPPAPASTSARMAST
jgi:hypothetical protein